jgi:hypothetical protein
MKLQECEGFQNTHYIRLTKTQRAGKTRYVVTIHYNTNAYSLDRGSKIFYSAEEAKEYIAGVPLEDGRPIKPPANNFLEKYSPA